MSDARVVRLAARYLRKLAGGMDVKNDFQAAKMVDPGAYAAAVYCLVNGCDPDTLRGDALEKAMEDDVAREAFEAKEVFDKINLVRPKASELALRYPIEVIKKHRANLSKLPKADQTRLTYVAKAIVAVVKYMRALTASKTGPQRTDDIGVARAEAGKIAAAMMVKVQEDPAAQALLTKHKEEHEGLSQPFDVPEIAERWARMLQQNTDFTQAWIEHEVQLAVQENFVMNTLEAGFMLAEDAFRLASRSDIEETLKTALTLSQSKANQITYKGLKGPEGTALVGMIRGGRDAQLTSEAGRIKQNLSKEVPATLLWYTVRGAK